MNGRGGLAVLLLMSTLSVMAGAIVSPVLALLRGELGISTAAAGFVLTAHALTIAVVSPLIGGLVDRYGVRLPLVTGLLLYGVGGGAGLVIDSYPLLIASRVVFGVGVALVFTGSTLAMLTLYRGAQRDRAMGWRSTATSLGGVAWPLLGGALGGLSWQAPFGVYLIGVPIGVAALLLLPTEPASAEPADAAPTAARAGGIGAMLRQRPVVLGYCVLLALLSLLLYTMLVLLPARLAELGVTDTFLVALITAGNSVVMSVVGLGYARLRARFGYRALLRTTFGIWTVSLALLGVGGNIAVLALATAAFGVGMGVAIPALTVLVADSAPPHLRGRATSLGATFTFVGQPAAPALVGSIVDATTTGTGFLVAAGLSAAVLLVLLSPLRPGMPEVATCAGTAG